jgi:hypothetical protein
LAANTTHTKVWQCFLKAYTCLLRVEKGAADTAGRIVNEAIRDWSLAGAKSILLTFDTENDEINMGELPANVTIVRNIHRAINSILAKCFDDSAQIVDVLPIIHLCYRIVKTLKALGALSDNLPQKFVDAAVRFQSTDSTHSLDFADSVYFTVKFVKEHFQQIRNCFEQGQHNDILSEMAKVDWSVANVIEIFLEPFHETNQMFTDSKQPHFHRIFPEWYALIHECQLSNENNYESDNTASCQGDSKERAKLDIATWLSSLRQAAERHLKAWAKENIRFEHKIATALYPRLKQLQVICSDMERAAVYGKIREIVGLIKEKPDRTTMDADGETENKRKRRHFLSQLEECAVEDDELDAYLRTPFAPSQTKNVLEFWSSIGERQFPRLAKLARFILATSGACAPIRLAEPSSKLSATDINTLMMLRPEVLNSLSRSATECRSMPNP